MESAKSKATFPVMSKRPTPAAYCVEHVKPAEKVPHLCPLVASRAELVGVAVAVTTTWFDDSLLQGRLF